MNVQMVGLWITCIQRLKKHANVYEYEMMRNIIRACTLVGYCTQWASSNNKVAINYRNCSVFIDLCL